MSLQITERFSAATSARKDLKCMATMYNVYYLPHSVTLSVDNVPYQFRCLVCASSSQSHQVEDFPGLDT